MRWQGDDEVARTRLRVVQFNVGYFLDTAISEPQTRMQFGTEAARRLTTR